MAKTFTNNGQGRMYVAPANTAVPATFAAIVAAVTADSSAFVEVADIHEDGLEITPREINSELKNWNGETEAQDVTASWKFKDLNFMDVHSLKMVFGADNVTTTTNDTVVDFDGPMPAPVVLVAIMKDGDNGVCQVLRNAKTNAIGAYKFTKGDYSVHDVTMNGVKPTSGKSYFMVVNDAINED